MVSIGKVTDDLLESIFTHEVIQAEGSSAFSGHRLQRPELYPVDVAW